MTSPKVSVIIPIFNSREYIERCLNSLKNQTWHEWEAICVDDSSTDGTSEILDAYAKNDSRIKVIHKDNEGVSAARNDGMKLTSGKYIAFLDSDDFFHPQTLELTVELAEKENADMVAFTYHHRYRVKTMIGNLFKIPEKQTLHFKNYVKTPDYIITDDIYKYATEYSHPDLPAKEKKWAVKHCQPWRCLFRKDLVENIKFPEGIIYEDFPWWSEVLFNVNKAAILNLPLYYYYPNKRSFILSSDQKFRIESLKKAIEISESFYSKVKDKRKKELWEKNFLIPFQEKLNAKIKKYGDS